MLAKPSKLLFVQSRWTGIEKYSPDQLVVQNDPNMVANFSFGFDIDLSALDVLTDESSRLSSILSPESQHSSLSSQQGSQAPMVGLVIPSSSSAIGGTRGGVDISDQTGSIQPKPKGLLDDEEGFQEDAGFFIGPEGEIIETPIGKPGRRQSIAGRVPSTTHTDSAIRDRVRQDLEEGMLAGQLQVCCYCHNAILLLIGSSLAIPWILMRLEMTTLATRYPQEIPSLKCND